MVIEGFNFLSIECSLQLWFAHKHQIPHFIPVLSTSLKSVVFSCFTALVQKRTGFSRKFVLKFKEKVSTSFIMLHQNQFDQFGFTIQGTLLFKSYFTCFDLRRQVGKFNQQFKSQ